MALDKERPADEERPGRARGGYTRAQRLTREQRSDIARRAATARWSSQLSEAVCGSPDKPLRIGGIEIECYVLSDGTRVITQATFLQALGRHRKASVRKQDGDEPVPPILQGKAINPFIPPETRRKSRPTTFITRHGSRASGYNAELLPEVGEIYLKARDAGVLLSSQLHIARQAEILVRGLARVGIIALVDEATGYQEVRARDALNKILEAFIAKELQAWVQTFPEDFYRQLFRLRGLDFPSSKVRRPQYFGVLTNDIVYRRLAPGVLEELKRVTPRNEQGRPKHKYFQHLTTNIGYPKLREHLGSVVTLMKLSKDWQNFILKLDQIHPRVGDALLQFPIDPTYDGGAGL